MVSEGEVLGPGPGPAARRRHRDGGRARAPEAGFSLIEVCITVAIMGIALALLIGSMATTESTSNLVTVRSQTESYARRVGEVVRSSVALLCTGNLKASYDSAIPTALGTSASSDFTIATQDVAYSNDWTNNNPANWTHDSCSGSTPQREWVKIKVTSVNAPAVSVTFSILQRNASPS